MNTKLLAVLVVVTVGFAPVAHADPGDQQFLNLVHSNGIAGQDDTLITYAHEFCSGTGTPSALTLLGQGVVGPGQMYVVQTAASRVYCPDKIAVPPRGPHVYHGGTL